MNGSHWSLPGAGRMAAPRGSRGCPEEGVELCSITPRHPLGLPAGALLSGAKERLIAVRRSVADQSGKGRETMSRGNKPCNLFSPPPPPPPAALARPLHHERIACRPQKSLSPSVVPTGKPQPSCTTILNSHYFPPTEHPVPLHPPHPILGMCPISLRQTNLHTHPPDHTDWLRTNHMTHSAHWESSLESLRKLLGEKCLFSTECLRKSRKDIRAKELVTISPGMCVGKNPNNILSPCYISPKCPLSAEARLTCFQAQFFSYLQPTLI